MKKIISSLFVLSFLMLLLVSCGKKGCTDPMSLAYDSEAKKDDGTCTYPEDIKRALVFKATATWCPPCIAELPSMNKLYKDYGDKVTFLFVSNEELKKASYQLLEKNGLTNAYLRPLIYTNSNMGLTPATESFLVIQAWEWGRLYGTELSKVMTSSYQRPNPKSIFVDAKVTGHYANSILAQQEAKMKGFDEALLLDADLNVAEGSGANFFFEKDDKLYTIPKGNILPGITRNTVLELAKELEIEVIEKHFTPEEVKEADSAFFTGTAAEVAGIKSLDEYEFPLDWEDSLGRLLAKRYRRLVTRAGAHDAVLV